MIGDAATSLLKNLKQSRKTREQGRAAKLCPRGTTWVTHEAMDRPSSIIQDMLKMQAQHFIPL